MVGKDWADVAVEINPGGVLLRSAAGRPTADEHCQGESGEKTRVPPQSNHYLHIRGEFAFTLQQTRPHLKANSPANECVKPCAALQLGANIRPLATAWNLNSGPPPQPVLRSRP